MTTLTSKEIEIVAREVTGLDYVIDGDHIAIDGAVTPPNTWQPSFEYGEYWQRSQALAVAGWLCKNIYSRPNKEFLSFADRMIAAVNRRDISYLQRMVLELRNPK